MAFRHASGCPLPRPDRDPGRCAHRDAGGGQHPARSDPCALGDHWLHGVRQGRGRQSHGVVQGPRYDGRGHPSAGRRRAGGHLRLHGEHVGVSGRLRGAGRSDLRGADPARKDRRRQAGAGRRLRREDPPGARELRRLPGTGPQDRGGPRRHRAGELGQPGAHPGAEVRVLRDLRPARASPGCAFPAGRQCRATSRRTGSATRSTTTIGRMEDSLPRMFGFQAAGAAPLVLGHPVSDPETIATAIRIGSPASWHGAPRPGTTPVG